MNKYTEQLSINGQSFREFAFLCARKLSPFIFMADRPDNEEPPEEISGVSSETEIDYDEGKVLVKELSEIDPEDIQKYVETRIKKIETRCDREIKSVDQEIKRLMDMQTDALDWVPANAIMSLRQIMISELSEALVDANKRRTALYMAKGVDIAPEKYFQSIVEKASRDLSQLQSKIDAGEQERDSYKKWYNDLNTALPKIKKGKS